jgi:Flp pilus assembly protein TadG
MMKKRLINLSVKLQNNHGVTAVIVGIAMTALIGFSALAIDLGHLYVVKNELQNAADSGALAGARALYNDEGTVVNTGANQTGYDAAVSNKSEDVSVDVHGLQEGDVQRGHWSFATETFTANDSTAVFDLWNKSTAELDADLNFINAVWVKTRREDTPAASFLAHIFGHDNFIMSADAVAYKGFAGTLAPGESEMPIAICRDSILEDGAYSCNIGRMINSGQNVLNGETAGWTSYAQQQEPGDPDPCLGGTNANEVRNIVDPPGADSCFGENLAPLILGKDMATIGGEAETVLSRVRDCWVDATDTNGDGIPDVPWTLRLPVITCPGNSVGVCEEVVGAVEVNLVWITGPGASSCNFSATNLPPLNMGEGPDAWHCIYQNPVTEEQMNYCWDSFVTYYNLQNVDGSTAPCAMKSLYFMPDCDAHEPVGRSGGENFGVLAEIPALVE